MKESLFGIDWTGDLVQERAGRGTRLGRTALAATHAGKLLGERPFVAKLEDSAGTDLVVPRLVHN